MADSGPTPSLTHTLPEPLSLRLGPWPHLHTQIPNWKDGPKNKQAHTTAPTQACMGRARSWGSPSQGPKNLAGGTASTQCPAKPPAYSSSGQQYYPAPWKARTARPAFQLFISREKAAHHIVSKRCQKVTAAGQTGPTPQDSFQTTVSGHKAQFWHSDTW